MYPNLTEESKFLTLYNHKKQNSSGLHRKHQNCLYLILLNFDIHKTYIAYLEFQQSQAEVSIALGEIQGNNYIPEVYPNILIDLAEGYMMKGDLERGMGLISNIIESINVLTGDIMLANYTGVSTGARLQQMVGNTATAIYIWEDYKQFLLVHPDLANSEEEVAYYMGIAEEYLKELRNI